MSFLLGLPIFRVYVKFQGCNSVRKKTGWNGTWPKFLKAKPHHLNQPATHHVLRTSFSFPVKTCFGVILPCSRQMTKPKKTNSWKLKNGSLGRLFSRFAHSTLAFKTKYPLRNPTKLTLPITHPKLQGKQHPLETKKRAPCLKPFVVRKQVSLYYQPKLHAKGNRSKLP